MNAGQEQALEVMAEKLAEGLKLVLEAWHYDAHQGDGFIAEHAQRYHDGKRALDAYQQWKAGGKR